MASSVWCQNSSHQHHSKLVNPGKVKKSQNASVIPKKLCDFVFRRNVDNRVYRSESFRFIQKTDSFIVGGAARRSLKVPVIENYIDPVDCQENGKEEPSYHEIQERYNAPYYYSDTIKEAPEPPYCSPCPIRKSSYNFSRRGNTRGQIVRRCNNASSSSNPLSDGSSKSRDSVRSYIKNDKDISSQVFCRQLLPRNKSPVLPRSSSPSPLSLRSSSPAHLRSSSPVPLSTNSPVLFPSASPAPLRSSSPVFFRSSSPVPYRSASPVPYRSASPVPYRSASPGPYRSASPGPYRSASPVPYRSTSPVPFRSASPVPYRSTSPVPYRGTSPTPLRSTTPVLLRSSSTPLDKFNDVDELLEPIKTIYLEDKKKRSSSSPPQQRNQFVSVCHILNSPTGTITNFPISPSTPQLTPPPEAPRETSLMKSTSSHHDGMRKKPGVPFTHKYLKASVVRDKRLQMLKTSRSISSLDSADSLKSNEEMRSMCGGYEPHASHSGGSSTGSSTTSGSNKSNCSSNHHNNTVAIAVLDPSNVYYRPHCSSPVDYHHRDPTHPHESSSSSSSCLPKLQPPVTEPDEFGYRSSRPAWADPSGHSPSMCNARHLSHLNERPKSRKTLSVHSCDNSSTCSSNVSLPPTPDHYYTRLLARNSGLGRLDEICYNHHHPHSVKVDVIHSPKSNSNSQEHDPGYCPMGNEGMCSNLSPFSNLSTFMPAHLGRDGKSHALSDINYVRPHRCWNLPLESQEWFHGAITRLESEKILEATKVGSFLVRNCENSTLNHFSLSIKCKRGFIHIRIEPNPGSSGTFTLAEQEFSSVPYLINHFMLNRLPIKGAEHTGERGTQRISVIVWCDKLRMAPPSKIHRKIWID
ncbi:unnamed protein product [Allacma fusca]|uniref:SH2 domain-containing protein n=1 Tax=Allacma fusca TaxID=39272 RepID=A0A8J2L0F3_9HEXA|nr:unnamed protein product [Allacma fusca]